MTEQRPATNTLILTNVSDETLQDPSRLLRFLSRNNNYIIEIVSLIKFGRIIIVCESISVSRHIREMLLGENEWSRIVMSFSLRDNEFSKDMKIWIENEMHTTQPPDDHVDYLELPSESGSRRFLISPPLSPCAEWNHWDKAEEGPNTKTVHSPEELSHLLWERLGGFDSSTVRKYQDDNGNEPPAPQIDIKRKPEILFQDINNGVPAIMLDSANTGAISPKASKIASLAKTSMPPPME